MERFFRFDKNRGGPVLGLYAKLRELLAQFPRAAILGSFNLRKRSEGRGNPPDLLTDPRGWLEEISGVNEILTRADVRLGLSAHRAHSEIRVLNGVRRGEEFEPIVFRPVEANGELAGFDAVALSGEDLGVAFTREQAAYYSKLPDQFQFSSVADTVVPRSSLSRLLRRALSLGIIKRDGDTYWKPIQPRADADTRASAETGGSVVGLGLDDFREAHTRARVSGGGKHWN
jgi:hypothetical protein